ncbi:retrovirus-related pol polyprotein from transposon TNT 1-94 [Tanacetum coccineum]|uniref:Retrovirus-related pol polyprotein from transposon TNT 1-94 n=1 Tax=Tanacetum coccineum TaxID=301880 RepID=A0ABQ5BBW8_9ASTR
MTTSAEHMIVAGAENRLPMLDKTMYNSWQSRMLLCVKGKKNGRMMLESIENGPFVYLTIEENDQIRNKKYAELTKQEKLQDDSKDIWDRVKLLMQGTELSYQERECKPYNGFEKFTSIKGESLHEYYLRFAQLINDMHTIGICSDDPIACLKKAMAFMSTMMASRFPSTNNQLRTSFNPRNQATIQDGRVTVQQVQGRQGQSFVGTRNKGNATSFKGNNAAGKARVVKCYNCQGEGHMTRQCTQPKRLRNSAWFKEKMLLVQAQESGQELDEEQLEFLADPGIPDGQAIQTTIPQNAAFKTDDLDAYDSDYDDISSAKAVLMANLLSYGSDVFSEKALYKLKQAPQAWYDLLSSFLLSQKFSKGTVDPTLFTWKEGKYILLYKSM